MQNLKLLFSVTLIVVSCGYARGKLNYEELRKRGFDCTEGQIVQFDRCNYCQCEERGVMVCRRLCGFIRPENTLSGKGSGFKRPINKKVLSSSIQLEEWTPKWKKFFEETASCKVGEQRRDPDDCNWCKCTAPGSMVCDTNKKCSNKNRETLSHRDFSKTPEDVERWKKFSEAAESCKVGDTAQDPDGCNMCECIENGVMICSRTLCGKKKGMFVPKRLSKQERKTKKSSYHNLQSLKKFAENAAECTVGDRMKDHDNCNWCECVEKGVMLCSRKGCVSKSSKSPSLLAHGKDAAVVVTASYSKLSQKNYYHLRDKTKDCIPGKTTISTPCHVCKCMHHGAMKCVSVKGRSCDKNKKSKQKNPILKLDLPADTDYFAYS